MELDVSASLKHHEVSFLLIPLLSAFISRVKESHFFLIPSDGPVPSADMLSLLLLLLVCFLHVAASSLKVL